jgi:replicative DNA helicase
LVLHFQPAEGGNEADARHAADLSASFLAERGVPRPTTAYAEPGAVLVAVLPGEVDDDLAADYGEAIERATQEHVNTLRRYHGYKVSVEAVGPDEPLPVREWSGDWIPAVKAMQDALDAEEEARYDALDYSKDGDAEAAQRREEERARKQAEITQACQEARARALEADEERPWLASVRELIASGAVDTSGRWDDFAHDWWFEEVCRHKGLPAPVAEAGPCLRHRLEMFRLADELAEGGHDAPAQQGQAAAQNGEPASEKAAEQALFEELVAKFTGLTSREFAAKEYKQEFLIEGVLVAGENGVWGGASKTLKTSTAADAAVSLGSATPFLGKFRVPKVNHTLFISGESGGAVVKDTARRICEARGIDLESLAVNWSFDLPELANPLHLKALAEALRRMGTKVVFVDPTYLALLSGAHAAQKQASSIFDMGPLLRAVEKAVREAGATLILLHHANRRIEKGKPMELADLSYAGLAEFAAQWSLWSRREPFTGDGLHKLYLSIGGRSGQGGLFNVDIDEGQMDENFQGRYFAVTVERASQAWANERSQKKQARLDEKSAQDRDDDARALNAVDKVLEKDEASRRAGWAGHRKARVKAGMNQEKFDRALARLEEDGVIEISESVRFPYGDEWQHERKPAKGIRRKRRSLAGQDEQGDLFATGA